MENNLQYNKAAIKAYIDERNRKARAKFKRNMILLFGGELYSNNKINEKA